ncbi:PPE domain-containing protein [Actinosynnema sp. CS-041913]|uniref:PPE domain-containing protein n=1 Tax=Actinosynnema sp. CS-041913 TaxID=3239917 RepID=UPI003D8AD71C
MTERRHRLHSEDHPPTPRQVRQARKVSNRKKANRRLENFGRINWDVYPHRYLWDMVKSADLGRMGQRGHDWKTLAGDIDQATKDVHDLVEKLVQSWRGPSSVVAAGSVTRLTQWATDASERAFRIGGGLDAYTEAVQEASRRMPEPVHPTAEKWFADGYDVATLDGPQGAYMADQLLDDHMPSKKEQQRAKAEAVRVMRDYEDASRFVHDKLPTFDDAPDGAMPAPDHRPDYVGPEQVPDSGPKSGPDGRPRPEPPHRPVPEPLPGARPEGTTTVAAAGGPAGFGIPGLPGGASVPGGYAAGSAGGHGAFGSGVPGGFGPGGFGPVGPGGSSGVIGAVPGGAAARGGVGPVGAGGPQGFGMFPPVAQGGREEDLEHRNRYDNGLDLLDDLPPAFPPVLGE